MRERVHAFAEPSPNAGLVNVATVHQRTLRVHSMIATVRLTGYKAHEGDLRGL